MELPLSWDSFRACTEILVTRFVDGVLLEIDSELDKAVEVTVFARGGVSAAEVASAGLDFEISVEGDGIVPLFHWIAKNIRSIIQRMFHPDSDVHIERVPPGLAEYIFIYVGCYFAVGAPTMLTDLFPDGWKPEVSMTFLIGANIAFAGAVLGADLGHWEIRFGAVFEGPTAIVGYFTGAPGTVTDVWVIKGGVSRL